MNNLVSYPLYSIIFETHPQDAVGRVVESFNQQYTAVKLAEMVTEIRQELAHPTRQVSQIFPGMMGTEADVREFLRLFADKIAK